MVSSWLFCSSSWSKINIPTTDTWMVSQQSQISRSLRQSFYKCMVMNMLIVMVMCLLINLPQIDIVEMFNNMRQEVHIVKVVIFNNLAMMYKVMQWFILMPALILWIGLLIMAKKRREILYWWYPSVFKEVHSIINKRNLWCHLLYVIFVNVVLCYWELQTKMLATNDWIELFWKDSLR